MEKYQPNEQLENLALGAIFVLVAAAGVSWLGAELACLLRHGHVLHDVDTSIVATALLQLRHNMANPKAAWPPAVAAQLPGPVLYWIATTLVIAAVGVAAFAIWRALHRSDDRLDRRQRLGVQTQGAFAQRRDLGALIVRRPQPERFTLGKFGRSLLATEAPQSIGRRRGSGRGAVALIGPTRSGKTTAAIGGTNDWTGPAILCSVKSDLLAATKARREELGGSIQVFDPAGVTGQGNASWSPLRDAKTRSGAVHAARALVEAAPRNNNVEHGEFWSQMAESLLAGLMCLAANTEKSFSDVVRWVVSTDMPTDAGPGEVGPLLRALRTQDGLKKSAGEFGGLVIEGLWRNDPRTVSSVYATARTMVWPWIDPLVDGATQANTIDLDWLLSGPNTLYICVPLVDQQRLRPVLGGLLNDLMNQAFDRYVRTNEPIHPGLLVVIDEAATLCPDHLPSWAATVSGIGIQLVTAWQSLSQIDAAYGRHAPAIVTNHLSKMFFAGMSDTQGLDYVSRILGDEHLPSALTGDPRNPQEPRPVATVPLVPASTLRRLNPGEALLVHGTLPPAHVTPRRRLDA